MNHSAIKTTKAYDYEERPMRHKRKPNLMGFAILNHASKDIIVCDPEPDAEWTTAFGYRRWLVVLQFQNEKLIIAVLSDVAKTEEQALIVARRRVKLNDPFGLMGGFISATVTADTNQARTENGVDDFAYTAHTMWEDRWHEIRTAAVA